MSNSLCQYFAELLFILFVVICDYYLMVVSWGFVTLFNDFIALN